jgi:hypothetical protein
MCSHCKAEQIVAKTCPTTASGTCYYCGAGIDNGSRQPHRDGCVWPPFAKAFS